MTINILGIEYKIKVLKLEDKKKYYEKYLEEEYFASWGFTDLKNKVIVLNNPKEEDYRYDIGETLWHEFGHALEREVPTSIIETEYTAVIGEYFYVYRKQLEKITKKLVSKYKK